MNAGRFNIETLSIGIRCPKVPYPTVLNPAYQITPARNNLTEAPVRVRRGNGEEIEQSEVV